MKVYWVKNENNNRATVPVASVECDSGNGHLQTEKTEGLDSRFNITVISYRKRKHDPDGISVKAVLDGLVRRKILLDDSWEEIKEITFKSRKCEKGQEEKTIIEIETAI